MEHQAVRRNVEGFVRAMDEEMYLNWAGLKDEMDTSSIFRKYDKIFDLDVLHIVNRMKSRARKDEERKLGYLHYILTAGYLERSVMDLSDEKNTMESRLNISVRGKNIPFRLAAVKMINEDDRALRSDIYDARNSAIDDVNIILEKRMTKLHGLAENLGYHNYAHLYSSIKGIDFEYVMKDLDVLVRATNDMYVEKFNVLTEEMGLGLAEAEKHDIGHILRAKRFDRFFEKEKAVPTLKKTLKRMGINLDAQKNVIVDSEERPKKSPRAFCAPLKVPDKVMLVIMPMGGPSDYDTLLHEAGHAEHYAHTKKNCPMEYKYLGDNSVTESYAFLLQYLTLSEEWLKSNTSMSSKKISDFLDFMYVQKLYFLRRYAAKLKYELKLHQRLLRGMDGAYKKTLESILKFKHPKNHYLTDLDDGFYAAQYLRAWLFEAQLERDLVERYGDEWFSSKKAGDHLKSLWGQGQKYNVGELSEGMGYELGPKELIEDFKAHIA